jgi:hypothetical protein
MLDRTFVEVAFYRVSPKQWKAEVDEVNRQWREAYVRQIPAGTKPNPESLEHYTALGRRATGHDIIYPYNQVVGWVHVEGSPQMVKAEAFRVAQSRVTRRFRSSRATFEWIGKVIELWFRAETSQQISAAIRSELLGLSRKGRAFAGRYADLEAFDAIAPYLDWRGLLSLA